MNPAALLFIGVGLFLLLNKRSDAAAYYSVPDSVQYGDLIGGDVYAPQPGFSTAPDFTDVSTVTDYVDYAPQEQPVYSDGVDNWDLQGQQIMSNEPQQQSNVQNAGFNDTQATANLAAFLAVIRAGESGGLGYRALYGGDTWSGDLSDHPAAQGWKGKPLPMEWCRKLGYKGQCYSDAAGAYQFISTTWRNLKNQLGLQDFSESSQDRAAIQLLKNVGALQYAMQGNLQMALNLASSQWASLPGSTAGQGGVSIAQAKQIYASNGGIETGATLV